MSMANKLDRMVAYLDRLLPRNSYDILIKWSCNISWQTKTTISPLSDCFWPPNVAGW